MIEIKRDGCRVVVAIEAHVPRLGVRVFHSHFNCGDDVSAALLASRLSDELHDTIRVIRQKEYEAGWKDARGRKRAKRDWFTWMMKREASL